MCLYLRTERGPATVARSVALLGFALCLLAGPAGAQQYRLRLGTRFQSVSYRGVQYDSVVATTVVSDNLGRLTTANGNAVRCAAGAAYCTYWRPGETQRANPMVVTADLSVWGFGVRGLSFRSRSRVGLDIGGASAFTGTEPPLQLIEGYFDYALSSMTVQLGRNYVLSRLGYTGFDGGRVEYRAAGGKLRAEGFGGLGLARGVALPVTSPELNPLSELQPTKRGYVVGGGLSWASRVLGARVLYERQIDKQSDNLVSERLSVNGAIHLPASLSLTGGFEYDVAADLMGSADVALSMQTRRAGATIGGRRYRPFFDLWTIWGAFSPTPYRAVTGSAFISPADGLVFRGTAEIFEYDDLEAATPLVTNEEDGWRWTASGTYLRARSYAVDVSYHHEFGPGAISRGLDGALTWFASDATTFRVFSGAARRPLEFRFSDSNLFNFGLNAAHRATSGVSLSMTASHFFETRVRPDAGQLDWRRNQWRLDIGASISLHRGVDTYGLPPAIMQIPAGGN